MARKYGYIDPLLTNLAVDHSRKAREGLVGPVLLPRVPVPKPSGRYAIFDREAAYKVPDTTMAGERAKAGEFHASAKTRNYATTPYGLKSFIDRADLEFMEGPFKIWELRKTELLVDKLELAQEKRIAERILGLSGDKENAAGNKWANGRGDPFADVKAAIKKMFFRPNVMVFSEAVYDALEYHPVLLDKLGEANLIKKVDEANLSSCSASTA